MARSHDLILLLMIRLRLTRMDHVCSKLAFPTSAGVELAFSVTSATQTFRIVSLGLACEVGRQR
jgi:hypothetical protein